jgi:hypothetical protein
MVSKYIIKYVKKYKRYGRYYNNKMTLMLKIEIDF